MKKYKVGVIELGYIGMLHMEMLKHLSNVEITAIEDIDKELVDSMGRRFKINKVYYNPNSLVLDQDIEIIHNCTPNRFHFKINKLAILNGKEILSEKPLLLNSDESGILSCVVFLLCLHKVGSMKMKLT